MRPAAYIATTKALSISVLAGLLAGAVLAGMNLFVAGQYIDKLADLYIENLTVEGDFVEEEFDATYQSLHMQQEALAIVGGIAAGALVGAASLKLMRGKAPTGAFKAALVVAGAAWFSLYVLPTLKYPANPDTLFDTEAAGQYGMMFAAYAASSGLAALGCAVAFAKTKRKNWYVGAAGAYLAIAAALFFVFPGLPEPQNYPQSLLGAWRSVTAAGATAFWFIIGILAGALLERAQLQSSKGTRKEEI
jgi:hypothetical protein